MQSSAPSGVVLNVTGYFVEVNKVAHELAEISKVQSAMNLVIVFIGKIKFMLNCIIIKYVTVSHAFSALM